MLCALRLTVEFCRQLFLSVFLFLVDLLKHQLFRGSIAILQNLVDLLLAQEIASVWGVHKVSELSQAHLLRHARYHVLLLRHLNIQPLLLHLHRVVFHDLLLRVEQSFQDLGLRLRQSLALLRLLQLLEVVREVLLIKVVAFYEFKLLV